MSFLLYSNVHSKYHKAVFFVHRLFFILFLLLFPANVVTVRCKYWVLFDGRDSLLS